MSGESLFGPPAAARVAFCIDLSSSISRQLPLVRFHLKSTLHLLANMPGARFNIITFSDSKQSDHLSFWSDRLTIASAEMLKIADDWIDAMRPSKIREEVEEDEIDNGASTFDGDALLESIQFFCDDSAVQAIHLLSGSAPSGDQDQESLLDQLVECVDGIPIHCVYLCEARPRRRIFNFFMDLAEDTGGTMRGFVADQCESGSVLCPIEKSTTDRGLLWRKGRRYERLDEPRCSVSTSLSSADPLDEWTQAYQRGFNWCNWWRYPGVYPFSLTPEILAMSEKFRKDRLLMTHNSKEAGDVLVGHQVLARRAHRGIFYVGGIQKKVSIHEFLVTFCSHEPTTAKDFETVHISDIIDLDDALRTSVTAGDCVLAPRGVTSTSAYEPAKVVSGFEKRDAYSPSEDERLVVTFCDGETSPLETRKAVWIPFGLHARFVLELDMSAADRNKRRQTEVIPNSQSAATEKDYYSWRTTHFPAPWLPWHAHSLYAGPLWNYPVPPSQGFPTQPLDMRTCSQPIYPSVGPSTHLRNVCITTNQTAESIKKTAAESTVQIVECFEEEKKPKEGIKDIEENPKEQEQLKTLEEEPLPYKEKGPFIDGFKDIGHPVAVTRPPLREIHRKPPWRYWGQRDIPNKDDPITFEPYKDPESIFGKPFSMTADLYPREKIEEIKPLPRSSLLVPEPTTPSMSMVGRIARDMSRGERLEAVLHRADVAARLRDEAGLSRVRADRRERLIRRQMEGIQSWAKERRNQSPDRGKTERCSHDEPWDWLDRKLIHEDRHFEMARTQFRRKQLFSKS